MGGADWRALAAPRCVAELAVWLVDELERAGALEVSEGWLRPTMAA